MAHGELSVRRLFRPEEWDRLAEFVCQAVRQEPSLSPRGEGEIHRLLKKGAILIGFWQGQPAGFIFRIPLSKAYCELAAWSVAPGLRGGPLGRALLVEAMREPGRRYVFFTYQASLFNYLKRLGARRIRLADLPWWVAARLLSARFNPSRLVNILQFKRRNREWILGVIET